MIGIVIALRVAAIVCTVIAVDFAVFTVSNAVRSRRAERRNRRSRSGGVARE